jgi:hypothetical protein
MRTPYQVILPKDQHLAREAETIELEDEPTYTELKAVIQPIIGSNRYFEHVRVWFKNAYTDMFVDDMGAMTNLPTNEVATRIYHANMLRQHPNADTSDWPKIHGPAVLFHRQVWF